jgi:hypothetical protein
MLLALRLGLTLADLNNVTIGLVLDMVAEASGNTLKWASQGDFDAF